MLTTQNSSPQLSFTLYMQSLYSVYAKQLVLYRQLICYSVSNIKIVASVVWLMAKVFRGTMMVGINVRTFCVQKVKGEIFFVIIECFFAKKGTTTYSKLFVVFIQVSIRHELSRSVCIFMWGYVSTSVKGHFLNIEGTL